MFRKLLNCNYCLSFHLTWTGTLLLSITGLWQSLVFFLPLWGANLLALNLLRPVPQAPDQITNAEEIARRYQNV
jgi:hypothetical protein